jgi:two-component system, chemotaxis family, chemotaxis protein CheY
MSCVLVVEDDEDVREFMELLLATSGYETMSAGDGEEALEKMRGRLPCVVLLDLQMPRMDGWQFREHQLRDPRLAHVPVVCITAFVEPHIVTRRLGLKCLTKPADFPSVLSAVQAACDSSAGASQ